ncbi:DUF4339 domain-containing protein [Ralstonia pickettii]|uniref:DUF4339 domain-containing protein n=1 Tax=Ralstonia pickettii TaxID=329 RepID=UPI00046B06E2|nr:DUF4339 domain-containing protein [Ralstonia pickettii]
MTNDNFYSIDRLVEFGLGFAVAQQMVGAMNHALQNTHIPGSQTAPLPRPTSVYYVVLDGKQAGPFSEQEVSRLIVDGKVTKDTYVWRPGMATWQMVESVADVLRLVALAPPPFRPEEKS